MREALVVLIVLFVIAVLTAIKYRRHIMTAVGIWREFKRVKSQLTDARSDGDAIAHGVETELVSCAKCGRWITAQQAIHFPPAAYVCQNKCEARTAV